MGGEIDLILGAGVTGLAAGVASGWRVIEANPHPGGICSSYYLLPDRDERLRERPSPGDGYRFEHGGGHWIFGGDPQTLHFIDRLSRCRRYRRRSAVYFATDGRLVPYPLQLHLEHLDPTLARRAQRELEQATAPAGGTLAEWLEARFGPTLGELFFAPFHERYTAGLWTVIAPQDPYKSPSPVGGRSAERGERGYNVTFRYPEAGLGHLAAQMAARATVSFDQRVVAVDTVARRVDLDDGGEIPYRRLISTLPLDVMAGLAGKEIDEPAAPYTSVLVVNIGGVRGKRCPHEHWLYVPDARSGFHRVGIYSNVDPDFVPRSRPERVGFYVETAFLGGSRLTPEETRERCEQTVQELVDWGFLADPEVVDPTWIDCAYTWARPGSDWRRLALEELERSGITMVGRYARWQFQGIAASIRDGLEAGHRCAGIPA